MMGLSDFSSFVNKYRQRFIIFADNYVHDTMIAEDIVMESFMYYWENRERLDEEVNVPAYVLTVVKHKCIDNIREKKHFIELSGESEDLTTWELSFQLDALEQFDPHTIYTEEIDFLINKALESLSEQTRQVFIMSRYENKSYNEIASLLGISEKGVEYHMSKAFRVLRTYLKDYLPVLMFFF